MDGPKNRASAPVLKMAVRSLREMALAAQNGEFLGSEQELRTRLGISRPTYRQAVRILEQDQILAKRMGVHGGCYASRPDPQAAARSASLYLEIEGATLHDLLSASHGLQQNALSAACLCADGPAKERLRSFINDVDPDIDTAELNGFLEKERAYEDHLLVMAGNPVLSLFFRIARRYIDDNAAAQIFVADSKVRRMRAIAWRRLGEAILRGDADQALAISDGQHAAFVALIPRQALQGAGVQAA